MGVDPNDFEEQALSSALCILKIWKHYVDDNFTILSQASIGNFLQHLAINSQQPTMETETNKTIPFLDTLVTRGSDGCLATSIYTKPVHTDKHLTYGSHHPKSV